jgi:hypothetical protein
MVVRHNLSIDFVFLIIASLILARFGEMYKNAIVEYKTNYFKERSAFSLFTRYMIGRGQDFFPLYFLSV